MFLRVYSSDLRSKCVENMAEKWRALRIRNNDLQARNDSLLEDNHTAQRELSYEKNQVAYLKVENEQLKDEFEQLKNELEQLKEQCRVANKDVSHAETQTTPAATLVDAIVQTDNTVDEASVYFDANNMTVQQQAHAMQNGDGSIELRNNVFGNLVYVVPVHTMDEQLPLQIDGEMFTARDNVEYLEENAGAMVDNGGDEDMNDIGMNVVLNQDGVLQYGVETVGSASETEEVSVPNNDDATYMYQKLEIEQVTTLNSDVDDINKSPEKHNVSKESFVCSYDGCNKTYTLSASLRRHVKQQHEEVAAFDFPMPRPIDGEKTKSSPKKARVDPLKPLAHGKIEKRRYTMVKDKKTVRMETRSKTVCFDRPIIKSEDDHKDPPYRPRMKSNNTVDNQYLRPGQDKKVTCNGCQQSFVSDTTLMRHVKKKSSTELFACDYPNCSRQFSYRCTLKIHQQKCVILSPSQREADANNASDKKMKSNAPQKRKKDEDAVSKKEINQEKSAVKHQRIDGDNATTNDGSVAVPRERYFRGPPMFRCTHLECGHRVFTTQFALDYHNKGRHIRGTSRDERSQLKEFDCNFCEKAYASKSGLRKHIRDRHVAINGVASIGQSN